MFRKSFGEKYVKISKNTCCCGLGLGLNLKLFSMSVASEGLNLQLIINYLSEPKPIINYLLIILMIVSPLEGGDSGHGGHVVSQRRPHTRPGGEPESDDVSMFNKCLINQ